MSNGLAYSQPTYHTAVTSCHGCRHFSITHKAVRPFCCKAFGVVSRQHPARDILSTSGEPCRMRSMSHAAPFSLRGDLS
jgi:hypothetical protein